ncbi:hypothetical protein GJAV_G00214080 [Gymnothorax javanicus]|nr:hypothetical protein GJAV_G00214080 [Gymnothorax javanicus]
MPRNCPPPISIPLQILIPALNWILALILIPAVILNLVLTQIPVLLLFLALNLILVLLLVLAWIPALILNPVVTFFLALILTLALILILVPDFNPGPDPNPRPDFNTCCNVNPSPNPNSSLNFSTSPYLGSNLDPGPDPNVTPDVDQGPNLGPDRNPGPNHSPKSNPHPNPGNKPNPSPNACHKLNPSPNLYPNVSVNLPLDPQHPASQTPQERPGSPQTEPPAPPIPVLQEPAPAGPQPHPAPDTLSYLESASLMSGTLESLAGLGDDGSSLGSDSELNGAVLRRTDKYGFLGGSQYSEGSEHEVRVEVARQREMKWLEMFSNWDKWVSRRFQKVKLRCRKGIPSSLRARAWQLLSNSAELLDSNPGKVQELEREQGDPKWLDIIEKDLHRQFPFHEMFAARGGHGQQDLFRILKAYTVYRPEEGYCQAQAPVAAVLLMHMPAEQAFWCLVQICEKYLPGYYSAGLEAIQLDGEIFFALLRRVCPMAYRHLKKFKIDPILYMTEWFMCIFSRSLPWACVLRVWDMFFCEGVKVVFRVGLVLLKLMLGSVEKLREVQGNVRDDGAAEEHSAGERTRGSPHNRGDLVAGDGGPRRAREQHSGAEVAGVSWRTGPPARAPAARHSRHP